MLTVSWTEACTLTSIGSEVERLELSSNVEGKNTGDTFSFESLWSVEVCKMYSELHGYFGTDLTPGWFEEIFRCICPRLISKGYSGSSRLAG